MTALAPLVGMIGVLLLCFWAIFGSAGLLLAPAFVLVLGWSAPRLPARVVMRYHGAVPLHPSQCPALYRGLAALARRAGLARVPGLYRSRSAVPNAFTVGGRDDAAIAVTDGLAGALSHGEIMGVLAHEVAHVAADDIGLMRLGDQLRGITSIFCGAALLSFLLTSMVQPAAYPPLWMAAVFALAPTALAYLQLALSRGREFSADEIAARLTGEPMALARALAKIEHLNRWTLRRMFGRLAGLETPSCVRTHPPAEQRIARLRHMAEATAAGHRALDAAPRRHPVRIGLLDPQL